MPTFLELRIPPPIIGLICAGLMWWAQAFLPGISVPAWLHMIAPVIFVIGLSIDIAALVSFRRARTTITPLDPTKTTTLVTSGIYGLSRNPMYLGLFVLLIAWCFYLNNLILLLGPLIFVLYITRFQIKPEERHLARLFGEGFEQYCHAVRRWL